MSKVKLFIGVLCITLLFTACKGKETAQGKLQIQFKHLIDNKDIQYDSMMYVNAANNTYLITEIKYFISRVALFKNGERIEIKKNDGIHYIDTKLEKTQSWDIEQSFNEGMYDSIQFIFGFNEKDNESNRFVNPPETSMAWPLTLGGGYHYMMMNGKYKRLDGSIAGMNIHLGIGQLYEGTTYSVDSITDFVHNHFTVSLPYAFTVEKNKTNTIYIVMNVENWFKNPHIYDHYQWGSHIMQKQDAMRMLTENAWNVFTMIPN
jgi:hypothetical protein